MSRGHLALAAERGELVPLPEFLERAWQIMREVPDESDERGDSSRAVRARGRAQQRLVALPRGPARRARASDLASTAAARCRPHSPRGYRGHLPRHRRDRRPRLPGRRRRPPSGARATSCSSTAVRGRSVSSCARRSGLAELDRSPSRTTTPITCSGFPVCSRPTTSMVGSAALELVGPPGLRDLMRVLAPFVGRLGYRDRAARGAGRRCRSNATDTGSSPRARAPSRPRARVGAGRGRPSRRLRCGARDGARRAARPGARSAPARRARHARRRPHDHPRAARRARHVPAARWSCPATPCPCNAVVELATGADVLVHEATFIADDSDRASETAALDRRRCCARCARGGCAAAGADPPRAADSTARGRGRGARGVRRDVRPARLRYHRDPAAGARHRRASSRGRPGGAAVEAAPPDVAADAPREVLP